MLLQSRTSKRLGQALSNSDLVSHVSSCCLCYLTGLPLLENKQSVTGALFPRHMFSPSAIGVPLVQQVVTLVLNSIRSAQNPVQ